MATTSLEWLPEECIAQVLSFTSPADACRSSLVSKIFRCAANSDLAWDRLLPSDYQEIIARSVSPLNFSSKKDLFRRLSEAPLLIDAAKKTFCLDKDTNKNCYMLGARDLSIAWSTHSLSWCWKTLPNSRFPVGVELVMTCWLEIRCKISTVLLSSNTTYGIYFVFQISRRAFGLSNMPFEFEVEVGNWKMGGTVCISEEDYEKQRLYIAHESEEGRPIKRSDGWLEVELGEFYNVRNDKEVKMQLREINGIHLKGGLIVEGVEFRPKY